MKIVVLGLRGFPNVQGGVETHCENIYPLIAAHKGVEVVVLARAPYVGADSYEYKGVHVVPLACPKQKFLEAIVHTFVGVFAAKKLKADILHIHAVGPAIMVPLARILGLKVVMTHHGPDYERKKWNAIAKIILRLGERWGCKFSHKVIAIADNIADDIKLKYNVVAAVIPNGVVVPTPALSEEILKKHDLKKHGYVLAVGRFVPEKGFHDLIDAYKFICLRNAFTWNLVIAGGADHEDDYSRSLKEKAAATPGVVLTGFIKGTPLKELYSHAGLFVLPSYYEGLPIVLLEALSYGLSCVVSDIPANRNVSLPDARFFSPGNIPALAKKINDFCLRPLAAEERAAQLSMITNEYNWPSIADATRNIYKSL